MGKYIISFVPVAMALFSGCISERDILYQPGNYTLDMVRSMAEQDGLRLWTTNTSSYRGLVSYPTVKSPKGTVVIFHGNGGIAAHRTFYATALTRRGYRVLLAEYPGYGGRAGDMSEESFTTDAVDTLKLARQEFDRPLIVWGESLGAAVAAATIAKGAPSPDGLVMFTPWDCLLNVARTKFPSLLVRMFLKDRYDSVENLAGYQGPTAVVLAGRDEIIPNNLGRNLYQSLRGSKRLLVMEGVGHNDWETSPGDPMWDEVMGYLGSSRSGDGRSGDAAGQ